MSQLPQSVPTADAPARSAPDRAMAILKLFAGAAFMGAGAYFFTVHAGQTWNEPKAAAGVVTGLALGIGAGLVAAGIAGLTGRRLPKVAGVALLLLCAVAGGVAEPRVIMAQRAATERAAWERLQASGKSFKDYESYTLWATEALVRPGVRSAMALAKSRQTIDDLEKKRAAGERGGRIEPLRQLIRDHRSVRSSHPSEDVGPAIDLARQALAREYALALQELSKRVAAGNAVPAAARTGAEARPGARPGGREFPEDPKMRAAFETILSRLANSDDDYVYLAFASEYHLEPAGASGPAPAAKAADQTIAVGDAFSPDREGKRHRAFTAAFEESIKKGFDEPVLRLRTLSDNESRQGKVVLDVKCSARRAPSEFTLTRDDKPVGKLFSIDVDWNLAVFDIDGKELVRTRSRSSPATSLRFRTKRSDPLWAPYSVMMDSAYYNYCREVTGRLGLEPPAVQEYFAFER